ncbi:MAG: polyphosphate kinase 1 [bacterium]|nr:polyphosphate kinase 1 [bacterium]
MKFFDRELSWLSFNHRVLQEAADNTVPLFDRIKFLAIFSSNLEEFFKVRVASIRSLLRLKKHSAEDIGLDAELSLKQIHAEVNILQTKLGIIYKTRILPDLNRNNIFIKNERELNDDENNFVKEYFLERVRLYANPMLLIKKKLKPFLRSGALYLAVAMTSKDSKAKQSKFAYGLVEIPTDKLPRFIVMPSQQGETNIIFLDDVLRANISDIFTGYRIEEICSVKLTRDADLYIDDEFTGSLLEKIRKGLNKRNTGSPSRFLYDNMCTKKTLKFLQDSLALDKDDLIPGARYHNFSDFFNFPHPYIKDLEYDKNPEIINKDLNSSVNIFETISEGDKLVHFPYESFNSVLNFIEAASDDPQVTEIKITLYRAAKDSRVINLLLNALNNGKKVTVFSEIKARFDEELNIKYARMLEEAGAVMLFSIPGLKVHAKMCLVIRTENGADKNYCYLSTGNFNEKTAKIYSDFGFFTIEKKIIDEVSILFEILEGRIKDHEFKTLLAAQFNMKKSFLKLINNEIKNARNGIEACITIKLNSLEDSKMIGKLYEASNVGVKINIIVRGICCLIPGIKGLSENIHVISIVDRYLEHSRIFMFHNRGDEKIFLASADWMKRNLNRRIEIAFPIHSDELKKKIKTIIGFQLSDNVKSRVINRYQNNIYNNEKEGERINSQTETYKFLRNTE